VAHANLLTANSHWVVVAGTWGNKSRQEADGPEEFTEAVRGVEEKVDLLRNFGPRVEGGNEGWWRVQARRGLL
jgi:hypothetical protein